MKRHFLLVIILILLGLFIAFSAAAHPYDEPLTFRKHLTDDGRVIYSNIPKKCFSNGYLTCQQLHPIYGMPVSTKKAESSPAKKASVSQGKQGISTTNVTITSWQCDAKPSCDEIKSCAEATFYLKSCGLSDLDRDGDGVPCEEVCSESALSAGDAANHDKVRNYFTSDQEKSVKDALWTGENTFAVGVLPDGTRRDGIAKYVCETLNDYGFRGKGVSVNVIDIVKLKITGKWETIGNTICK